MYKCIGVQCNPQSGLHSGGRLHCRAPSSPLLTSTCSGAHFTCSNWCVHTTQAHKDTHTHTRNTTQAVKELASWSGQSPPTTKHQKGKVITPKIKEIIGRVSEREATILPRYMVNNYNIDDVIIVFRVCPSLAPT